MEKFICKVRYDRTQPTGEVKKTTESALVEATTHGEAERLTLKEYGIITAGEFDIRSVSVSNYAEVVTTTDDNATRFYRLKMRFITLDERTGKEKATSYLILVQAENILDAVNRTHDYMKGSMMDYQLVSVAETDIQEIIKQEKKNES